MTKIINCFSTKPLPNNLFCRMFQDHPETRDYFPKFQDLDSPDKQRNSEEFKDHAEKVKCDNWRWLSSLFCVPIPHHPSLGCLLIFIGRINQSNGWDGPGLMADAWTPEGGTLVVTITGPCQGKLGWVGMVHDNGAYPEIVRPGRKCT